MILCALLPAVLFGLGRQPQTGRVIDSILGVSVGASFEESRELLDRFGKGGESEEEEREEAGEKMAWRFDSGEFTAIAVRADDQGRVKWVTGFLRPGKERPFETIGDLKLGVSTQNEAIWNIRTGSSAYRVVAKGSNKRASVMYLIRLSQ
ncbi:MAG TPA: hypothetical protein VK934_11720 [Fimbriimonas sp.]|nr:hypothetical protein [Fimbriimonas sp.]